jgi:hypothetical protein
MSRTVLADYLNEIARIRGTGAGIREISYYGALAGALNAVGQTLKPRVFCIQNLRNTGAGFPDLGLFVAQRGLDLADWPEGRPPDRRAIDEYRLFYLVNTLSRPITSGNDRQPRVPNAGLLS